MNIFVVDYCPVTSASSLCDQHVIKMPIESVQMLSTTLHLKGFPAPYKKAFINHPCTVWTRQSFENFCWLYIHALALCQEYTNRFKRKHETETALQCIRESIAKNTPELSSAFMFSGRTTFALAMPDKYKEPNPAFSYRRFYINEKKHFARYTNRTMPAWLEKENPYNDE